MQEIVIKGYRQNVLGIIFNKNGQVLIGQNSGWSQDWTFPKGGIEKGESKEIALYREIYEEVGLKNDTLNIIYKYKTPFQKDFSDEEIKRKIENKGEYFKGKKDYIFVILYNGQGKINLGITKELLGFKWIEIKKIGHYIENEKLLSIINIPFLKKIINNELFRQNKGKLHHFK